MRLCVDNRYLEPRQEPVVAPCLEYRDKFGEVYLVITRGAHLLGQTTLNSTIQKYDFNPSRPEATGLVKISENADFETGSGLEFYFGSKSTVYDRSSGLDYAHCVDIAKTLSQAHFVCDSEFASPKYKLRR